MIEAKTTKFVWQHRKKKKNGFKRNKGRRFWKVLFWVEQEGPGAAKQKRVVKVRDRHRLTEDEDVCVQTTLVVRGKRRPGARSKIKTQTPRAALDAPREEYRNKGSSRDT